MSVLVALLIAAVAIALVGARLPALKDDLPERYEQLKGQRQEEDERREDVAEERRDG